MSTLEILTAEDIEALEPHVADWDSLAVECERPFCAPAWMLAWWQTYRARRACLRVVLAREQGQLVSVAPFFAQPRYGLTELRLLGAGFSHRIGILAQAGREEPLASAIAAALAHGRPRPASVVFEGIDGEDRWPSLIAAHWPSKLRPAQRTDGEMQAPVIRLDGSYERWMERRERAFRKEARRLGRRLEEQGVSPRVASDAPAVDTLLALHHARWSRRGGSNVQREARAVLAEATARLASPRRLFVATLESPTGPIAAELVVTAGRTAAFWGGGFDPRWAPHGPGMQTMLFALRKLAEEGMQTADLGGGEHRYKQKMADETTTLAWRTVFPRGWRYPLIRLGLMPKHARLALRQAFRRLPAVWQERLGGLAHLRGTRR
jgi:CelD/BcsL family acetyltransferase involved in cellulose biosynthesis